MPPKLALLACTALVVYLLFRDCRKRGQTSRGLWLASVWGLLIGSRPVAVWLNLAPRGDSPAHYLAGNPIDRILLAVMLAMAIVVLYRRRVDWGGVLRANRWLVAFLLYEGLSICWSDFQGTSLKRWLKSIGTPLMILIALTEPRPVEAIRTVLRRAAYVLLPFSVVLTKYFPVYGRWYTPGGGRELCGVASNKNSLAGLCMVLGVFVVWELLDAASRTYDPEQGKKDRVDIAIGVALAALCVWIPLWVNSMTPFVCMLAGACIVLASRYGGTRGIIGIGGLFLVTGGVLLPHVAGEVSSMLGAVAERFGRDATLTGRTELWAEILEMPVSRSLGTGYGSFWLGARAEHFWERYWWHPNQAHNGYLDTLISLGVVGLAILLAVLLVSWFRAARALQSDSPYAGLRLGLIGSVLLCNWTEANFGGTSFLWFGLLVGVMWPAPTSAEPREHPGSAHA